MEFNESAFKDFCRLIPTPVCTKNLMQMRHERTCHVFKGFIGKCVVCGEKFTTNKFYGMLLNFGINNIWKRWAANSLKMI
jgi:hypothetical protein